MIERGRWEVCNDAQFSGNCIVLGRGQYDSLAAIGLNDRVSSLRRLNNNARNYNARGVYAAGYPEYRRRGNERTYEARVTSVRAVVGPPEQRCWVEQEQVVQGGYGGDVNVPGAIAGAVIGGILGHQIGGGRGQDIATAGGAVGGAALGAQRRTRRPAGGDARRAALHQREQRSPGILGRHLQLSWRSSIGRR